MRILFVNTLLQVVSRYDLFECSVHVSDWLPKKINLDSGWMGVVSSIHFVNVVKPLNMYVFYLVTSVL